MVLGILHMQSVTIITHSGSFHPDDVFAVSTLLLSMEKHSVKALVVRTRDQATIERGDFVVDVGGVYDPATERFDHHQIGGAGERDNGIPYASFGLVWKKYGEEVSGSASVAVEIERRLVLQVDALDNGTEILVPKNGAVRPYLINHAIFAFLPTWKNSGGVDDAFLRAVDFAKDILLREIANTKDRLEGVAHVERAYREAPDKRIIVLDREYLWAEIIDQYPEPLFVVYPQEDRYHVKAVRTELSSFATKVSFPETWAGKRDAELARVTGVSDALFCHNKRFIAVARTKEGALALATTALVHQNS